MKYIKHIETGIKYRFGLLFVMTVTKLSGCLSIVVNIVFTNFHQIWFDAAIRQKKNWKEVLVREHLERFIGKPFMELKIKSSKHSWYIKHLAGHTESILKSLDKRIKALLIWDCYGGLQFSKLRCKFLPLSFTWCENKFSSNRGS